jgi:hypothetical protein
MRVNVYAEEHVAIEHGIKEIDGDRTMFYLRFKLKAHPSMVPPEHRDDDSPAVTFWFDTWGDAVGLLADAAKNIMWDVKS